MTIPAYFYPGSLWDKVITQAQTVDNMIVNPHNGSGTSQSTTYTTYIKKIQSAGIKAYGYIYTSYGSRDISLIKDEVDKYNSWYKVNGIFLDEVATSTSNLPYYQEIANYVRKTPGMVLMINPGTVPAEGYVKLADITNVFEGEYSTYQTRQFPSWIMNYPSSKFSHLVHNAPTVSAMKDVVTKAKNRNAGYLFITNDIEPNPWNTLPSYWAEEISALKETCATTTASPSGTPIATFSPTPAPSNGSLIINPIADSRVDAGNPNTNYGALPTLWVDASPLEITYLKFDLLSLSGKQIVTAKLRLNITGSSYSTQVVKNTTNVWTETGITYNSRPALGTQISTFTSSNAGTWKEIDVTSGVLGKGGQLVSFGIDSTGTDGLYFNSKEATQSLRPQLVVSYK